MRCSVLPGLLAAGLLAIGSSASALGITLSEMSSDNTPAGVLDATLTFTDNGDGTFDLDVANTSDYDINLVAFNLTAAAGTLALVSFDGNACPGCGWSFTTSEMVDGFGTFDFQVQDGVGGNPAQVDNGETKTFVFSFTGTAIAFDTNSAAKIAAAKFVEGPAANDPDETVEDSAFGASGTDSVIPEPATAWLLGLGIAGLLLSGRKRA